MNRFIKSSLLCLMALSALVVCGSIVAEEKSPKILKRTYVCTLGKLIWNQSQPCKVNTPEREAMIARYTPSAEVEQQLNPKSFRTARIAQLGGYPEKFVGEKVRVDNLWVSGKVTRSDDEDIPEGQRSVVRFYDNRGDILDLAIGDDSGFRLSGSYSGDRDYPVEYIFVEYMKTPGGLLAFLRGMKASSTDSRPAVKETSGRDPMKRLGVPTVTPTLTEQQMTKLHPDETPVESSPPPKAAPQALSNDSGSADTGQGGTGKGDVPPDISSLLEKLNSANAN